MIISLLIAILLAVLPYISWWFIFYICSKKLLNSSSGKIKSSIFLVFLFTAKLLIIGIIIYSARNIIVSNLGYFFINFFLISLVFPFIFNKMLFLTNL